MMTSSRFKIALLAAASLTAASAAIAHAADGPPVPPVAIEHAFEAGDQGVGRAGPIITAKKLGIAAAATAVLAGLVHLIGLRRLKVVAAATAAAAGKAASASIAATATAAKAVARAVSSPLRYAMLIAGLALFVLTGVGLYDVEWLAGLLFGALIATTVFIGAKKARKAIIPVRARRGVNR